MKRPIYIQKEVDQVTTIEGITSIFESIASIHIAQIKDRVVSSTSFFHELWQIYSQLRVDPKLQARLNRRQLNPQPAVVVVTSEGGLIGDIDDRIVNAMLAQPEIDKADLYVIGSHGVTLLGRHGLKPKQSFAMPEGDENLHFDALIQVLDQYSQAAVYYQTYVSLLRQDVSRIDLFSAVEALSQTMTKEGELISPRDYIFEPSLEDVIRYLESIMRQIALDQVVLESKLAQYASRFNAMSSAKRKATEMRTDLRFELSRSKRSQSDERIKETLAAMKMITKA
ncbi:MAG TPA: F0F1 ATP synthase subunit gamma [Candidatus Saccharimonadales bacterium]|nr:F0F1 ATP synthase subunit gamma [Candidatus Saccharimonadales bacterium]